VGSIEKGKPTNGLIKAMLVQTGLGRPVANYLLSSKRKNMGNFLEFWDNL
jgi:hypothetical protein